MFLKMQKWIFLWVQIVFLCIMNKMNNTRGEKT